jgi:aryl-alcohol dehydrogenase-like predicted oxidoreductase
MKYTTLGKTGITVSEYCLGTMMFGAMGNRDHDDCVRIIHKAIDGGVNFIDSAHFYSAGESEEIVAKALEGKRDEIVLSTKFFGSMDHDQKQFGGSRRWIIQEVENSLRRFKTDYIDLYQIARFDDRTDLEETISALSDLVHQGKIRSFGSSMFSADRIVEAQWIAEKRNLLRFRCEQPWYSIFSREIEQHVLPACQRYGMGAIVWSPLDGGWLTGRYQKKDDFKKPGRVTQPSARRGVKFDPDAKIVQTKFELLEGLNDIANEAGISLTHMSMAFSVEHPAVTSAIIGPRTMEQLDDLINCADLRLDCEVMDRIDELVPPGTSVNGLNTTALPVSIVQKKNRRRPGNY